MRTSISSENLNKPAPISIAREGPELKSKSQFDSKITSVIKGLRTQVA